MSFEKRRSKSLFQPPGTFEYVVKENDSLRSLAAKYDVNLSILKSINKLMTDVVFPNQILYIPTEEYSHYAAISFIPVKNNEQKPGHAERLGTSLDEGYVIPPRPLSYEEVIKIDEECHHKFVKINSICLADDGEEVPGVLLITPDGVMFDPDPTTLPMKERGVEEFQLVDSIMSIISSAVFHDESLLNKEMKSLQLEISPSTADKQSPPPPPPPHDTDHKTTTIDDNKPTLPDDDKQDPNIENKFKEESDPKNIGHNKKDEVDAHGGTVEDDDILILKDVVHVEDIKNTDDAKFEDETADVNVDVKLKPAMKQSISCEGQSVKSIRKMGRASAPSSLSLDDLAMKVFLRLKVHKNIDSLKSFKVNPKKKNISRLEYWFAVPNDKNIDQLYAFFKRWTPSMANALDSEETHFIEVESDSPVARVIDQSNDLLVETAESVVQWKKRYNLKKDWEIVSVKEYRRLLMVVEIKKLPLPELSESSRIFTDGHVAMLTCNLPALAEGMSWCLMYSTEKHGFSLNTLYRKLSKTDLAFFLVVQDTSDNVFGALVVGKLKMSDHFYGSGESYLFTFYPEFKRFNWTGINNFFIKGSHDSLVFGASEGNNGLWLDADLYHGRTQACQTFDNEVLTSSEDFVIKCIEVWSFV